MLCGTNLAMYEGPNFSESSPTLAVDYVNYPGTTQKALSASHSCKGKRMITYVKWQFRTSDAKSQLRSQEAALHLLLMISITIYRETP